VRSRNKGTESLDDLAESPEDRFKRLLLELGLLTEIKPPLPPGAIPRDRQPIPVEGNPVSELIMSERR
jgi:hypothetical protein